MLLNLSVLVSISIGANAKNSKVAQASTKTISEVSAKQPFGVNEDELVQSIDSALSLVKVSEEALSENERKLAVANNDVDKKVLEQEQELLISDVNNHKRNLIHLVTGDSADLFKSQNYKEEKFDWKQELTDVVQPLVKEVKGLTELQRQEQELKQKSDFYREHLVKLDHAFERVKKLQKSKELSKASKKYLQDLEIKLAKRTDEASNYIQVLNLQKKELEAQKNEGKNSWSSKMQRVIGGILFHFLLALFGAFFSYYLVNFIGHLLNKVDIHDNPKKLFVVRAVQFILRLLAMLVAVVVYSAILITFGEWALMSISGIVLFGLVLTVKDVLPKYLTEMRTILNMGSIREGERVMYKGVPWRVNNLNFYTEIQNRDLGVSLRLPIDEVANLKSRMAVKSELWFPTRSGDYVILNDGVFGQVVRQSPDMVLIDSFGSLINYQTSDFLAAKPNNLSRQRFTLFSELGLDYKHQAHITKEMLGQLRAYVQQELKKTDFAEFVNDLDVEFDKAADYSLNLLLIMKCKGAGAQHYNVMKRWLQKMAVECCNENDWEIPFPQVTMHQAKGSAPS